MNTREDQTPTNPPKDGEQTKKVEKKQTSGDEPNKQHKEDFEQLLDLAVPKIDIAR